MLWKIKTFGYSKKCMKYENNVGDKIVNFNEDIQIYLRSFFDQGRSFRIIVKYDFKNEKFYFELNLCEIRNKC